MSYNGSYNSERDELSSRRARSTTPSGGSFKSSLGSSRSTDSLRVERIRHTIRLRGSSQELNTTLHPLIISDGNASRPTSSSPSHHELSALLLSQSEAGDRYPIRHRSSLPTDQELNPAYRQFRGSDRNSLRLRGSYPSDQSTLSEELNRLSQNQSEPAGLPYRNTIRPISSSLSDQSNYWDVTDKNASRPVSSYSSDQELNKIFQNQSEPELDRNAIRHRGSYPNPDQELKGAFRPFQVSNKNTTRLKGSYSSDQELNSPVQPLRVSARNTSTPISSSPTDPELSTLLPSLSGAVDRKPIRHGGSYSSDQNFNPAFHPFRVSDSNSSRPISSSLSDQELNRLSQRQSMTAPERNTSRHSAPYLFYQEPNILFPSHTKLNALFRPLRLPLSDDRETDLRSFDIIHEASTTVRTLYYFC